MSHNLSKIWVNVPPVERVITLGESMVRLHKILEALDIPSELDGLWITYDEASDEEGAMLLQLAHLVQARFAQLRPNDDGSTPW